MKKKLLSILLVLSMMLALVPAAFAADIVDSGTCGADGDGSSVTWTLDAAGLLTISGTGKIIDGDGGSIWSGKPVMAVDIRSGITAVGSNAFFGCDQLQVISLPDTVTQLDKNAFGNCAALSSILVDAKNPAYKSVDGALYSKDGTVLIKCPADAETFVVPDGVGGRFSELCPVGLLAAAVTGIDIEEMLAGAAAMDERCKNPDYMKNPALFAAGAMYAAMDKGMNIHVMMPYADSLKFMADWYAQLWAESLGKNVHRDGTPCAVGQTPVKALGVTDQHSQVQLYTEGPDDKVITFLRVGQFRSQITIPVGCNEFPDVAFLCGKTLNELLDAELSSTEYALLKAAKPSWRITLPEVNAYTLGQLMYFFEMQTAYAGELLDIDAFNQPGVEEGKNAAYALLGRKGYENKAAELNARPEADPRYVL